MLTFGKMTDFPRGTLYRLLVDGYSFDSRWQEACDQDWQDFDTFFYDNPAIAERYGFMTLLDGVPIGHVSWDPRGKPEQVVMGHNCIATSCKGRGYGAAQMMEAVRRIREQGGARRLVVTTNAALVPAQRTYQRAGFVLKRVWVPEQADSFTGVHMEYEILF